MFIKLKDHKILGSVYNPEKDKNEVDEIPSLAPYMNDPIIDAPGDFTVEDLMEYLVKHEKETDVLFYASKNGHRIRPFYDDLSNEDNDPDKKMDEIEIGWSGHIYSHEDDDLVEHTHYEVNTYATGIKYNDPEEGYAFHFSYLGNLKDAMIRLNPSLYIYDVHMIRMPEKVYYCGEQDLTLRDVIDAFLREITFDGYPETRKQRFEELKERIERSEEDIESGRTYTMDEMHLGTLDAKLRTQLKKENYENAEVIRQRISDLEQKILDEKGEINRPYKFV